ncbi:MAG: hypothetical protein SGI88_02105 [Candidatus Hydrogenedentes bacterium]|nr:hypothetical protein [Candidatus Hydrogenedentota bacterium]
MTDRWKDAEREAAEALGGTRVIRQWNLFESAADVLVPDFGLVCDCKAYRRFSIHTLIDTVKRKYCGRGETPALVTKSQGQHGAYITLPMDYVGGLLDELRAHRRGASYGARTQSTRTSDELRAHRRGASA